MNQNGPEIKAVMDFYQIAPNELLIAHDEADFAPGKLRLRYGGGTGGHRGIESVQRLIPDNYWRLRIGVGRKRPLAQYLLAQPENPEREIITAALIQARTYWPGFAAGQWSELMNRLHRD